MNPNSPSDQSKKPLDGLTILRFAHAYETGGGVELHLRDLNHGLSQRNAFTTILVHLTKDAKKATPSTVTLGASKLVKVPLRAKEQAVPPTTSAPSAHANKPQLRDLVFKCLDQVLFSPGLNKLAMKLVGWRKVPERELEAIEAGSTVSSLFKQHEVDLVVLHCNGGADTSEVIAAARREKIPVAMIHHFSNDKLGNMSVRQQASYVRRVAGASHVGLPRYIRRNFTNLSDAVNLDFFQPTLAKPLSKKFPHPVLFAPGRLTPDKGQMDALKIAMGLRSRGIQTDLVFAGRVDDHRFEAQLRETAQNSGMADQIHFAGELNLEQYRDWLAGSYLMLMPTHHHEGMPRTLVESQAMMTPALVYDIGGTRDGVRHGETGYLVPFNDIAAMTNYAAELIQNPQKRSEMAQRGRAFIQSEFSLDAFLRRHEVFYLEAINGR